MEPTEKGACMLRQSSHKSRIVAIGLSIGIGTLVMLLKFYAYWLTDSSALLSDALESIINVIASSFALWSILYSARPPDRSHPYGHGKIEYFAAGFEGALIILAAIGIFQAAWPRIMRSQELVELDKGLLLLAITGLTNLFLALGLIRVGNRTHSIVLVSDGKHIMTDVFSTVGVFAGLLLVRFTGYFWLDGVIAILMATMILITGIRLMRQAFAGLMDESDPSLLEEIAQLLSRSRKATWIDIHRLRAWRAGNQIRVDFHIVLPKYLTLQEISHTIEEVQRLFTVHYGHLIDVLVHTDPCCNADCPACAKDACSYRKEFFRYQTLWQGEKIICS